MTTLAKTPKLGDLLKYEFKGNYSREVITLKSGTNYSLVRCSERSRPQAKYRLSPAAAAAGDESA